MMDDRRTDDDNSVSIVWQAFASRRLTRMDTGDIDVFLPRPLRLEISANTIPVDRQPQTEVSTLHGTARFPFCNLLNEQKLNKFHWYHMVDGHMMFLKMATMRMLHFTKLILQDWSPGQHDEQVFQFKFGEIPLYKFFFTEYSFRAFIKNTKTYASGFFESGELHFKDSRNRNKQKMVAGALINRDDWNVAENNIGGVIDYSCLFRYDHLDQSGAPARDLHCQITDLAGITPEIGSSSDLGQLNKSCSNGILTLEYFEVAYNAFLEYQKDMVDSKLQMAENDDSI